MTTSMLTTTPFIFQDVVEGLEAAEDAINTDMSPDWKNESVDNPNVALLEVWLCHHVRICQFLRTRRLLHICQHVRAYKIQQGHKSNKKPTNKPTRENKTI